MSFSKSGGGSDVARNGKGCGGDVGGEDEADSEGEDGGDDSYDVSMGKVECVCERGVERLGLREEDEGCCGNSKKWSGLD